MPTNRYGIIISNRLFIIETEKRILPRRLIALAELIIDLDTRETLKCQWDERDLNPSILTPLFDDYPTSHIPHIEEVIGTSFYP